MNTPKRPKLSLDKEQLWADLANDLTHFNKRLLEIIAAEAWKPAYETFTDAWADKMSGITLAQELLPHIMYAMFDEGNTVEEVVENVKGVGPEVAKRVKKQKDSGVPVDQATIVVRRHKRKPAERHFLPDVELDEAAVGELRGWKRSAKKLGMSWDVFVLSAIRAYEGLES